MFGPIAGPTLGGWLTDNFNWRWVFFVNIPVGVPALLILWRLLPDTPISPRKFDTRGFCFLAIGLAALQIFLDRGQQNDWLDSTETIVELLAALVALYFFAVHSWFSREPVFPRNLMANGRVYTSMAFGAVQSWAMLGIAAILPSMLQGLFGYSVMQTGEVMAPRGLGIMLTMSVLPMVMERFRVRVILAIGFAVVAFTNYEMTTWTLDIEPWRFGVNSFVQGLGLGLLMMPINYYAFSSVRPEERTDCASLLTLFRNVSGSIGISVFVTILSRSSQTVHAELVSRVSIVGGALQDIPGIADGDVASLSQLNAEITRQAAMIAHLNVFQLLFVMTALTVPVCLLVRGRAR